MTNCKAHTRIDICKGEPTLVLSLPHPTQNEGANLNKR